MAPTLYIIELLNVKLLFIELSLCSYLLNLKLDILFIPENTTVKAVIYII